MQLGTSASGAYRSCLTFSTAPYSSWRPVWRFAVDGNGSPLWEDAGPIYSGLMGAPRPSRIFLSGRAPLWPWPGTRGRAGAPLATLELRFTFL
jgi:hypothetical protein